MNDEAKGSDAPNMSYYFSDWFSMVKNCKWSICWSIINRTSLIIGGSSESYLNQVIQEEQISCQYQNVTFQLVLAKIKCLYLSEEFMFKLIEVYKTLFDKCFRVHVQIIYRLPAIPTYTSWTHQVLVFCTTAMVTSLVADLLSKLKINVREIHSRKPQGHRNRISDEFRKSKGLILVTSDVSARGVDYPDVTLVIQVEQALSNVAMKNKKAAYKAWLGYYNSSKIGKDKSFLVTLANEFSRSMGLDNPPALPKHILDKIGIRNVPGLRTK
ncbi:Dead-box atp-dependent rna helicase [Thalictrum thalictroides]|uniref:ATP-dependent RNA helicase n=1 Tax=Thalictrum thalictroides TaxID=46969 RepID=A0A7J6WBF2_THATH|nr:Dead-box atp-dependent rna helicase [Thalictrum thalictroides]